ncbi:MAG TPA: YkgJ family cysteine cluster protein [Methanomicrobiales archaeon]|nr:YkgJ family cysteine cluster protein [Methanomicrobiales archaeon]
MGRFECDWCGKCCVSLGEYITIVRQLSERDYFCRYGVTNEIFQVHVTEEFVDEVDADYDAMVDGDTSEIQKRCIFSRRNPNGPGYACAIYPTRPTICREFQCYRMLIYNVHGELLGKVIGFNELKTHDETLAQIWADRVAHLPHPFSLNQPSAHPHSATPAVHPVHGHESRIQAVLDGFTPDDREWIHRVIAELAASGFHGEPVEEETVQAFS